jgi:hypothetical protein
MADERQMPNPDPTDVPSVESLLTQTLETHANRVEPPADALARLQTRLETTAPARQPRPGAIRWAMAGAIALLLLVLVSPVGRATAASIGHAARNAITTVRDAVTGNDNGEPTPARGTSVTGTGVPGSATAGSGSATARSGSATARAGGTVPGTITGTAGSGTAVGTPRSGSAPAGTANATTATTGPAGATATAASVPAPLAPAASPTNVATSAIAPATATPQPRSP